MDVASKDVDKREGLCWSAEEVERGLILVALCLPDPWKHPKRRPPNSGLWYSYSVEYVLGVDLLFGSAQGSGLEQQDLS